MSQTITLQTKPDFENALALMDAVRNNLPDHEKHFLKPKTLAELFAHHAAGDLIAGIKTPEGKTIGLAIVKPESSPSIFPAFNQDAGSALVQSVCIHPDYTGKGLAGMLFPFIENWSKEKGLNTLAAKISAGNGKSLGLFLKFGFRAAHTGTDPAQGYEAVIVQKHIAPIAEDVFFPSNTGHDFCLSAS